MAFYWKLNAIPELYVVPAAKRRRLWAEAVTRSSGVRQVLIMLLVWLLFFVSFAVLGYLLLPMHDHGLWLG